MGGNPDQQEADAPLAPPPAVLPPPPARKRNADGGAVSGSTLLLTCKKLALNCVSTLDKGCAVPSCNAVEVVPGEWKQT